MCQSVDCWKRGYVFEEPIGVGFHREMLDTGRMGKVQVHLWIIPFRPPEPFDDGGGLLGRFGAGVAVHLQMHVRAMALCRLHQADGQLDGLFDRRVVVTELAVHRPIVDGQSFLNELLGPVDRIGIEGCAEAETA